MGNIAEKVVKFPSLDPPLLWRTATANHLSDSGCFNHTAMSAMTLCR